MNMSLNVCEMLHFSIQVYAALLAQPGCSSMHIHTLSDRIIYEMKWAPDYQGVEFPVLIPDLTLLVCVKFGD